MARWTRIWWVRPFFSRHAISLAIGLPSAPAYRSLTSQWVQSPRGRLPHRHLVASMRMPVDRRINGAAGPDRHPPTRRNSRARDRPCGHDRRMRRQRLVRLVGLGHHMTPSILVEPVHDARPHHPDDAGQVIPAMAISALTRCRVRGRRLDRPPPARRAVDDDDLVVLIQDRQRDWLALRLGRFGGGTVTVSTSPAFDLVAGSSTASVGGDGAVQDQRFQSRARQFGESAARTRSSRWPDCSSPTVSVSMRSCWFVMVSTTDQLTFFWLRRKGCST